MVAAVYNYDRRTAAAKPQYELRVRMRGDAENLKKLLQNIDDYGSVGHSFSIVPDELDPDTGRKPKAFGGWDGDGADRIESIEIVDLETEP